MTGTRFEFIKDDRDITMQHPLGWIAAYQEEMKLMDRQGSINKESEGLVQVCRFLVEVHQCSPEEQHLSLEHRRSGRGPSRCRHSRREAGAVGQGSRNLREMEGRLRTGQEGGASFGREVGDGVQQLRHRRHGAAGRKAGRQGGPPAVSDGGRPGVGPVASGPGCGEPDGG
ncbi:uncharacterized protein LOC143032007 isoform X1 [Oratosquilla oratoria]|uniref:uncharacterized protein LOC143032007 isoform X1 n=1 Tax=Oratosquilla oratoria TaxID=337810 RepID=UPI003F777B80